MNRTHKIFKQVRPNPINVPLYGRRISKKVVVDTSRIDIASKYFVADRPGAIISGTRFSNILDTLEQGLPLSKSALMFLQQQKLLALYALALGEITYDDYRTIAAEELFMREHEAAAERQEREKEAEVQEAKREAQYEHNRKRAEEDRRNRESDPKYIAKIKNKQLRLRYGLDQFIEVNFFSRLMPILRRLDGGNRLTDEDILWLTTEGKNYYTDLLQEAFHEREAEWYKSEYKRTNDPWNAVNASGHYRKCNQARKAHDMLTSIPDGRRKAPKINSAICTTHGGVMRDLKRYDKALELGEQAHALTPKDFRPCTLLGAVNIEIGNYGIGKNWYDKAEERGASKRSIDFDLRGILLRADNVKREKLKTFLLREDPERYEWVLSLKVKDHVSV